MSPAAEKISDIAALSAAGPAEPHTSKYDRLIARAKQVPSVRTVVAHPCDESSLRGPVEAAEAGIVTPIFVGPKEKISVVARTARINIDKFEIVDAAHSDAAAAKAVEMIREGKGEVLMKGSLHTDELMRAVTSSQTGLRTARRISHVFVMDVPTYAETLFITDAAINIFPDLDAKRDIIQNAIDPEAARIKGIKSEVAGRAQILVVPDLEAGNMLAKNLSFMAKADSAGLVLGARVPVVLTSRADSVRSRMASCAVAVLYADARRKSTALPKA